jgi:hypothetical protein
MKHLHGLGFALKLEELSTVKDNVLPNTLVLENSDPFPGYHGNSMHMDTKPRHLFLVLDRKYPGDEIIRKACEIRNDFNHSFDASFGETTIQGEPMHFIRIRGLKSFTQLSSLQHRFADKGFSFSKIQTIHSQAIIKVYKYFRLEEIADGIFRDEDESMMFYLKIKTKPDWQAFEKVTLFIKQNVDIYNFDAALAILYGNRITDLIRIYAKDPDINQLKELRDKYLQQLEKNR